MNLWGIVREATNSFSGIFRGDHGRFETRKSPVQPAGQFDWSKAGLSPNEPDQAGFEPICGVALEKYAALLALMSEVGEDEDACLEIADQQGVSRFAWQAAKEGWTLRMNNPALEPVRRAFVAAYSLELDKKRSGKEPISLERFVKLFAEMTYRKNPDDFTKQIDRETVLRENGLTVSQWNEVFCYWTPRVTDPSNPVFPSYLNLLNQETKRYVA